MPRRRRHVLPEAEPALDTFKLEVAEDLSLEDDIKTRGWGNMTTREVGKIGGNMVRRMIERAERNMVGEEYADEPAGSGPAGRPTRSGLTGGEPSKTRPRHVGRPDNRR